MSVDVSTGGVPQFGRHHRLALALEFAGVGVQEMADYLGVSRESVSRWINGRGDAGKQTLRLWAVRCGVPLEWLETGQAPAEKPGPDDGCAARDSNPEPASKESRWLKAVA